MRKREIEKLLERAVANALGVDLKPRRSKVITLTARKTSRSNAGDRVAA